MLPRPPRSSTRLDVDYPIDWLTDGEKDVVMMVLGNAPFSLHELRNTLARDHIDRQR